MICQYDTTDFFENPNSRYDTVPYRTVPGAASLSQTRVTRFSIISPIIWWLIHYILNLTVNPATIKYNSHFLDLLLLLFFPSNCITDIILPNTNKGLDIKLSSGEFLRYLARDMVVHHKLFPEASCMRFME